MTNVDSERNIIIVLSGRSYRIPHPEEVRRHRPRQLVQVTGGETALHLLLRELLKDRHVSYADLSEASGMSLPRIDALMNYRSTRVPSHAELVAFAAVLRIDPSLLFQAAGYSFPATHERSNGAQP
jgi:hypothetical protein